MNHLDKYLPEDQAPHGLRSAVSPFFSNDLATPQTSLNGLRQFLERLLHHLSVISGVNEKSVSRRIDRFVDEGVINRQVGPYFHLWWNLSCLGSHFQEDDISDIISWCEHLDLCRRAASICLLWYAKRYPPLSLTRDERQVWLRDASSVFTVPVDQIQVSKGEEIEEKIRSTSVVLLHGRPWTGKTSIASYWVTELVSRGYIPLVVHENSLVTFRIIPQTDSINLPNNLKLATNAQTIHEIIGTRLLHGDSFVVFLDDPFGHRRYRQNNPLMFLRIADWLRLASGPQTLGNVKVLITTPSVFIEQGSRTLQENARTNPIARDNLALLDREHRITIDISLYDRSQLLRIIEYSASHYECSWSGNRAFTEMVADVLVDEGRGFDALHVLCRDYKTKSENELLEGVLRIADSANVQDELHNASNSTKIRLCAAYVGEALIEFYREFAFQTRLSFDDLCSSSEEDLSMESEELALMSDWLLEDRVATMNLSEFPVFLHPEIRFAVATLAETVMHPVVQTIMANITGLSKAYSGVKLMRWEAVHLICRMANYITEEQAQFINDEFFFRAGSRGGDPRNILWAILGNWHYIERSVLERYSLGFLKSLEHNYKPFMRPFIWEATENWTHLSREIRYHVLALSGRGNSFDELEPTFNEHHTVAFLAAGVSHYGAIQDSARAGCQVSERYLDFISALVVRLAKSPNFYSSRNEDGLFNAPGSQYSGKNILDGLVNLGRRRGTLDDTHPFVIQVATLLG